MKKLNCLQTLIAILFVFLLAGTEAWGLTRDRRFRVINAADGLADNSAQTIRCTFSGRMVISTIGHINIYDGSGFTHISSYNNRYYLPKYKGHYHLYFDDSHRLWLKDKHQVTCVDLMTEKFVKDITPIFREQGMEGQVEDMFIDSSGKVWLIQGNFAYADNKQVCIPLRNGRILQDLDIADNNVLLFYDDSQVDVYEIKTARKVFSSVALTADKASDYAGSSVVYKYRTGFFQIRNGNNKAVLLWLDVRQRKWKQILELDYYLSNMTLRDEILYVSSAYGYWTYNIRNGETEHFETIALEDGRELLTDMNCIEFDRQGGMWIGTEKRGLLYSPCHNSPFNALTWEDPMAGKYAEMMDKVCDNKLLVSGHRLNCTYKDSRGWIWVGSLNGLYYFKPGVKDSVVVKPEDGMINNVVHSIVEDSRHNMWLSTSNGIVGMIIKGGKIAFINSFSSMDGIPSEAFVNDRAMRLPDGKIVMQALDHVVVFNPSELTTMGKNNLLLHPKFVRLQVNGTNVYAGTEIDGKVVTDKAISRLNTIELSSTQNSLSLKFSALNYFRPLQTYYRYRVIGLHNEWNVLSHYNSRGLVDKNGILHLPLLALRPGRYVVEVQASMFPDQWNTPPVRVVINVNEPWWRTTGLSLLVAFVFFVFVIWNVVIFSSNYRLRMKRNVSEFELIRRIDAYISRAEACRSEWQIARGVDGLGNNNDMTSDLDEQFVDFMLELMPYSKLGTIDHDLLDRFAVKYNMKLTRLYDIITTNIFRSPRMLTQAILLETASKQLRNTNMPVEKIAEKNKFASANFFISSFYHRYGVTPAQWRLDGTGKVSSL